MYIPQITSYFKMSALVVCCYSFCVCVRCYTAGNLIHVSSPVLQAVDHRREIYSSAIATLPVLDPSSDTHC